jgi:hypothetical protein
VGVLEDAPDADADADAGDREALPDRRPIERSRAHEGGFVRR